MSSGLQAERTELAWRRTALSSWAVALLATKTAFPVGAAAFAGPLTLTVIFFVRRRRLRSVGEPPSLSPTEAALATLACMVVAGAGVRI